MDHCELRIDGPEDLVHSLKLECPRKGWKSVIPEPRRKAI